MRRRPQQLALPRVVAVVARHLVAGLVVGALGISLAVSFAALVFRGELAPHLGVGIGWGLVGMLVLGVVAAGASSFRGLAAGPQDVPTVVMAAVAVDLVATSSRPLATLAAFVVAAGAFTGMVLVLLGRLRLGGLVRYVPFSVVAGFMGGSAVVLVRAGTGLLAGAGIGGEVWLRLAPGLVLAAMIVLVDRRRASSLAPAVLVVAGVAAYHVVAALAGIGRVEAVSRQLVLGPFPEGRLLDVGVLGRLGGSDWGALGEQVPAILVMALLVALGHLLTVGALEHAYEVDIDGDRELVAAGTGLLLAAPFAGWPGYALLSDTMVARQLGGRSRIPPLVGAALALVVLLAGGRLVTLLPVLVPGGMLVSIGVSFGLQWIWDVRRRVGRVEHLVILAIVVVVATLGFVEGVGLGILAATAMFVARYSRVEAIRVLTTLRDRRSHVQRSADADRVVREQGHRVAIVQLEGFVFFGTAEQVVGRVLAHLAQHPEVETLLVDLDHVTGLDSSATASFQRLARHARGRGLRLVMTGCTARLRSALAPVLADGAFRQLPDLDRALEVAEEAVLGRPDGAAVADAFELPDEVAATWHAVPSTPLPSGAAIITRGDEGGGLFLLEEGRAAVAVSDDGGNARHAVLLPGSVIGELSLLTGQPANATVVCETDCRVRHLSAAHVEELTSTDPAAALRLHRFVAQRLATKLDAANRAVRALL